MAKKVQPIQAPARRIPQQTRSFEKVELILEAATRLLEQGDVSTLTTNAVAAKAGVSIGTLYQYFNDKQALLDALVQRELGLMSETILDATQGAPADAAPGDRIRRIVRSVVGAYGGRSRVHRQLIEHALTRTSGSRLSPLYAQLTEQLKIEGSRRAGGDAPAVVAGTGFRADACDRRRPAHTGRERQAAAAAGNRGRAGATRDGLSRERSRSALIGSAAKSDRS